MNFCFNLLYEKHLFLESGFVQQYLWGLPQRGLEAAKLTTEAERCRSQLPPNSKFINSFSFTILLLFVLSLTSFHLLVLGWFTSVSICVDVANLLMRESERVWLGPGCGAPHTFWYLALPLFDFFANRQLRFWNFCILHFQRIHCFFVFSAVGDVFKLPIHFPSTWSARPVSQCYGTHECFVFRFAERASYPINFTAKSQRFTMVHGDFVCYLQGVAVWYRKILFWSDKPWVHYLIHYLNLSVREADSDVWYILTSKSSLWSRSLASSQRSWQPQSYP